MQNNEDIFENKNERNDFIIALVVIAVFITFCIIIYKNSATDNITLLNDTFNKTNTSEQVVKSLKNNKPESLSFLDTKQSVKSKSSKIIEGENLLTEKQHLPKNTTIENSTKSVSNIIGTENKNNLVTEKNSITETIDEIPESVVNTENNTTNIESEDVASENEITESKTADSLESSINNEQLNNNTVKTDNNTVKETTANTAQNISKNTDCVIVVGVFKNENNLVKMLNRIEQNGYPSAQGFMRNGTQYAGVPVDCKENKTSISKKLNTLFNVQSWVFKNKK